MLLLRLYSPCTFYSTLEYTLYTVGIPYLLRQCFFRININYFAGHFFTFALWCTTCSMLNLTLYFLIFFDLKGPRTLPLLSS